MDAQAFGNGEGVYLYNKALIEIGDGCVLSRFAFLCTASHDINSETFDLYSRPIILEDNVWIAASSIVLPGIRLAIGSVIGAGSIVTKSTQPWHVYAGNPALMIKKRTMFSAH
jgi:putative colanic acid biosynthesis acetyltransferase WcaF